MHMAFEGRKPPGRRARAAMACAAAACGGLALGSLPLSAPALGLGLCALLLLAWWAGSGADAEAADTQPRDAQSAQLLSAVLPVWQRGVEAARLESEHGLSCLLAGYTGVAARVERAGATADHGAGALAAADNGATDALEKMLVGLQSQDRLSQMLVSTTDDMARCMRWLQGADDPTAAQPELWLERLHASHTMAEMRAAHHDTAAVDRGAAFELF